MSLSEVLELAIGSGDDVGSLNLKYLKQLIGNILQKMEISDDKAEIITQDQANLQNRADDETKKKIDDLEEKLQNLGEFFAWYVERYFMKDYITVKTKRVQT